MLKKKTREKVFQQDIQTPRSRKTRLRLLFLTHFPVFGYPDRTLLLVFDILHE